MAGYLPATSLVGTWAFVIAFYLTGVAKEPTIAPSHPEPRPVVRVGLSRETRGAESPKAHVEATPARPAAPGGRMQQGAAIRVEARFREPTQVVRWMLERGWVAVLVGQDNKPLWRVLTNGRLVAPGVLTSGVPRQATAEVAGILAQELPQGVKAAWLVWPARTWGLLERKLLAHEGIYGARLEYVLTPEGLAVKVLEVHTVHGSKQPGEIFVINS